MASDTYLSACLAVWFACLTCASTAAAQTVTGQLVEVGTGRPVELGIITLLAEESDEPVDRVLSAANGWFTLRSETPGSFLLSTSAWGFEDRRVGVFEMGEGGELIVEVSLVPRAIELEELVVDLDRPIVQHQLVSNGFVDRFNEGFGLFITPVEVGRSAARSTTDLFRGLPGVTLLSPEGGDPGGFTNGQLALQVAGGWCTPTLFLDGIRLRYDDGISVDAVVPLRAVEGVEIYRTPAEVPVAFNATRGPDGGAPCGVILLWTRRGGV